MSIFSEKKVDDHFPIYGTFESNAHADHDNHICIRIISPLTMIVFRSHQGLV
jgi:hypothetical protein